MPPENDHDNSDYKEFDLYADDIVQQASDLIGSMKDTGVKAFDDHDFEDCVMSSLSATVRRIKEKAKTNDPVRDVRSYFCKTARFTILSYKRKYAVSRQRIVYNSNLIDSYVDDGLSLEYEEELREMREMLKEAISSLQSDVDAQFANYYYLEGYSKTKIAKCLTKHPSQITSIAQRVEFILKTYIQNRLRAQAS